MPPACSRWILFAPSVGSQGLVIPDRHGSRGFRSMGFAGRFPDAAPFITLAKPKDLMAEPVAFPPDIVIATDIAEAERVQQLILDELQSTPFNEREIFAIKLALEEALVNAM